MGWQRQCVGNVWEWMGTPYKPEGKEMTLRGGAWGNHHQVARVSFRDHNLPDSFFDVIGFRIVLAPVF